jgi:two-component system OmpR family sensor kinase
MGLGHYVRARLHRRIFVWFGASIVMTGATVWVVLSLFSPEASEAREHWADFHTFVGDRFAHVWDTPAERDELASSIADGLRMGVVLRDAHGEELREFGPECDRVQFDTDVRLAGNVVGRVELCSVRHDRVRSIAMLVVVLIVACGTLWGAAGLIARRLGRPLWQVARVAADIGNGQLQSRVRLHRHHRRDEIGMLAEAINDMATRIEKQLKDQRELLAAVSHELRTPLGHARVLLEMLRDRKEGDGKAPTEKTIDELEREIMEIDDLVGELLASSRLSFDTLSYNKLEALDIAARALERVGLPLDLLSSEDETIGFEGDATLLGRALANLLENAKRHGGGVSRLRIDATDSEVTFVVEDKGPGFTDAERERVFDAFYRGDHRAGAAHGSLGLGLSLVRRIALAHGGRAWAENREGGGARVGLRIARKKPEAPKASASRSV